MMLAIPLIPLVGMRNVCLKGTHSSSRAVEAPRAITRVAETRTTFSASGLECRKKVSMKVLIYVGRR